MSNTKLRVIDKDLTWTVYDSFKVIDDIRKVDDFCCKLYEDLPAEHIDDIDTFIRLQGYPDIQDDIQLNFIKHGVARAEYRQLVAPKIAEIDYMDGFVMHSHVGINRIPLNSTLYQFLLDWYGRSNDGEESAHELLKSVVAGAFETQEALYFTGVNNIEGYNRSLLGGINNENMIERFRAFITSESNFDYPKWNLTR